MGRSAGPGIPGLLPLLGISALFSLVPDVRPGEEISTQLQRGDGAWHQSLFVVAPNGLAKTGITGAWKFHKDSALPCHVLGCILETAAADVP